MLRKGYDLITACHGIYCLDVIEFLFGCILDYLFKMFMLSYDKGISNIFRKSYLAPHIFFNIYTLLLIDRNY